MFDRFSTTLLRGLRVPPRPEPPQGRPGSERTFRSGRNALRLSLTLWAVKQVFALGGLIFGLWMLGQLKTARNAMQGPARATTTAENPSPAETSTVTPRPRPRKPQATPREVLEKITRRTPASVFWLLTAIEGISVMTYLAQIPVTYALRRLEYEQRWYIVTDRSLRLRSGVWKVQEVTMSFANLQQITVTQGPLQRALGLADVRVQSAGGGSGGGGSGGEPGHGQRGDSMHLGHFHAVDNAGEIRDLILERLRQFRESGLGDPEESGHPPSAGAPASLHDDTLAAARELLAEARSLRHQIRGGG